MKSGPVCRTMNLLHLVAAAPVEVVVVLVAVEIHSMDVLPWTDAGSANYLLLPVPCSDTCKLEVFEELAFLPLHF